MARAMTYFIGVHSFKAELGGVLPKDSEGSAIRLELDKASEGERR